MVKLTLLTEVVKMSPSNAGGESSILGHGAITPRLMAKKNPSTNKQTKTETVL